MHRVRPKGEPCRGWNGDDARDHEVGPDVAEPRETSEHGEDTDDDEPGYGDGLSILGGELRDGRRTASLAARALDEAECTLRIAPRRRPKLPIEDGPRDVGIA